MMELGHQRRTLIWWAGLGAVLFTGAVLSDFGAKWWRESEGDEGDMPHPVELPPAPSYLAYGGFGAPKGSSSYGAPKGPPPAGPSSYGTPKGSSSWAPPKPKPPPMDVDRCCFPIDAGSTAGACGGANRGCIYNKSDAGSGAVTSVAAVGRNGTSCFKDEKACQKGCGGIWCPSPTPAPPLTPAPTLAQPTPAPTPNPTPAPTPAPPTPTPTTPEPATPAPVEATTSPAPAVAQGTPAPALSVTAPMKLSGVGLETAVHDAETLLACVDASGYKGSVAGLIADAKALPHTATVLATHTGRMLCDAVRNTQKCLVAAVATQDPMVAPITHAAKMCVREAEAMSVRPDMMKAALPGLDSVVLCARESMLSAVVLGQEVASRLCSTLEDTERCIDRHGDSPSAAAAPLHLVLHECLLGSPRSASMAVVEDVLANAVTVRRCAIELGFNGGDDLVEQARRGEYCDAVVAADGCLREHNSQQSHARTAVGEAAAKCSSAESMKAATKAAKINRLVPATASNIIPPLLFVSAVLAVIYYTGTRSRPATQPRRTHYDTL